MIVSTFSCFLDKLFVYLMLLVHIVSVVVIVVVIGAIQHVCHLTIYNDHLTSHHPAQPVLVGQPLVVPLLPHGDLEAVLLNRVAVVELQLSCQL